MVMTGCLARRGNGVVYWDLMMACWIRLRMMLEVGSYRLVTKLGVMFALGTYLGIGRYGKARDIIGGLILWNILILLEVSLQGRVDMRYVCTYMVKYYNISIPHALLNSHPLRSPVTRANQTEEKALG